MYSYLLNWHRILQFSGSLFHNECSSSTKKVIQKLYIHDLWPFSRNSNVVLACLYIFYINCEILYQLWECFPPLGWSVAAFSLNKSKAAPHNIAVRQRRVQTKRLAVANSTLFTFGKMCWPFPILSAVFVWTYVARTTPAIFVFVFFLRNKAISQGLLERARRQAWLNTLRRAHTPGQ